MSEILPQAPPLPWERQVDEDGAEETPRAYQAFCVYRDMDQRSLRTAAAIVYHGGTEHTPKEHQVRRLKGWSSRWGWVDRAKAWDDEQQIVRLDARKRAIERMEDRQAKQAERVEEKVVASILRDLEAAEAAEERLAEVQARGEVLETAERRRLEARLLSVHQRRLMWETASRQRRRALGEPETIEEQRQKLSGSVNVRREVVAELGTSPEFVRAVQDALAEREAALYGDGGAGPVDPLPDDLR